MMKIDMKLKISDYLLKIVEKWWIMMKVIFVGSVCSKEKYRLIFENRETKFIDPVKDSFTNSSLVTLPLIKSSCNSLIVLFSIIYTTFGKTTEAPSFRSELASNSSLGIDSSITSSLNSA